MREPSKLDDFQRILDAHRAQGCPATDFHALGWCAERVRNALWAPHLRGAASTLAGELQAASDAALRCAGPWQWRSPRGWLQILTAAPPQQTPVLR